ncbi:hypothetical protein AHAS_Ahas05G0090200 [Arachis hypogaea]
MDCCKDCRRVIRRNFFLELGVSPRRSSAPSRSCHPQSLSCRRLRLVVVLEDPNPPMVASSSSSASSRLLFV